MAFSTRGVLAFVPLFLLPAASQGQQHVPEDTRHAAIGVAETPAIDRPERIGAPSVVLTNRGDVERTLRRAYRVRDMHRGLGKGTVVLQLQVRSDGTVASAKVLKVKPSGHHPALNAIARKASLRMVFRPAGSGERTVIQRIVFHG